MDLNTVLSPAYLSTLKGLSLKARLVLEGTLAGRHLSPFHGFSSEFSQYKGYVPGDDLKHLDWKVLGRSGQLVTRQYRDETNAAVYLVVDSSRSMAYAGGGRRAQAGVRHGAGGLGGHDGLRAEGRGLPGPWRRGPRRLHPAPQQPGPSAPGAAGPGIAEAR